MGTKGNRVTLGRKGFSALFLLVNGLGLSGAEILPKTMKTVRESDGKDLRQVDKISLDDDPYDSITMMGHRIGFLEKNDDLVKYFLDIYQLMQPQGQMLLTFLDPGASKYQSKNMGPGRDPGDFIMQYQYGNLLGPFFGLLPLEIKTLIANASSTGWKCNVLHQVDDRNYLVWLTQ
jgi:cyclopropane fatty-acyl-phospholipid synthase-like methyltransferase